MYLNENQIQPTQLGDHDPGSNAMQWDAMQRNWFKWIGDIIQWIPGLIN